MQTGYKIVMGLAGIAIAGTIAIPRIAASQDHGSKPQIRSMEVHDAKLDRTVTRRFDHAPVREVLDWLGQEGVSFVIRDSELTDSKISLNIAGQPLWDAAQAVADALGGHWQKEGEVFAFRSGPGFDFGNMKFDGGLGPWAGEGGPGNMKELTDQLKKMGKELKIQIEQGDGKGLGAPNMDFDPADQEKFAKQWEEWGKKFADNFGKDGRSFAWTDSNDKAWSAYGKKMEEWAQQFSKEFAAKEFENKDWSSLSQAQRQRLREKLKNMHIPPMPPMPHMPKMVVPPMPPMNFGNGRSFTFDDGDNGKKRVLIERNSDGPEVDTEGPVGRAEVAVHDQDFKQLLKSLTTQQRQLQDERGYLKISDLTEAQRALIGKGAMKGTWKMRVKIDGQTLELRND